LANSKYKIKTVVLRPILDYDAAEQIVENRKTTLFRSMLQKPKKTEVRDTSACRLRKRPSCSDWEKPN